MANVFKSIINSIFPPQDKTQPGGNVLQTTTNTSVMTPTAVVNSDYVNAAQPYGTAVPTAIRGRASGWAQIQNLSTQLDISKVQAAFRAAERGDTTLLFAYYRDLFLNTGMVSTELQKRKLAVLSEPFSILPVDKKNADDVRAAKAIEDMIANCPSWNESLVHLMNAIVYPVAVAEKTFRPVEPDEQNPLGLRYYLHKLYPVDYILINYRLPYLPQGPIGAYSNMPPLPGSQTMAQPWFYTGVQSTSGRPEDTIYDADSWEPDLRFWHTFNNGIVDYAWSNIYAPDPNRHFVYRCNLLNGIARDNFGGNGRALLFWAIMAQLGRETFLRLLNRYGVPFMVAHVDTSQVDTVNMLEQAFDTANILNGLILNKDAVVELEAINLEGAAKGNEMFCNFCNDQISLLISGQTLSSHAKGTGMGSGVAKLQGEVRSDILSYDRITLGTALRNQLFTQFLKINGIKGRPPLISWGGGALESDKKELSITIQNLHNSGIQLTEESLETLGEKLGLKVERFTQTNTSGSNASGSLDNQNIANKTAPDMQDETADEDGVDPEEKPDV